MGLEHVGRCNLPERPNSAGVQTSDIFLRMGERMGRPSWRPACGIETNFRRDTFLGQDRQADFYVRDAELGMCMELDLGEPDLSLPKAVSEYAVLALKEPVTLAGDPMSLGAVVKGNSGWGRLYWILEGADGKRTVSSGHKGWKEDFDDPGKMSLGFSGWRFLAYPVDERSSIRDYSINLAGDLWSEGAHRRNRILRLNRVVGFRRVQDLRPVFCLRLRCASN